MDYTDVIIIKGPVETLSFFSERLAETFYTELNKNVIAWDMKKPLESRHFIENIREKAVLISFPTRRSSDLGPCCTYNF